MKKYSVTLLEHVRWTYEVEANNEKEAVDIACCMDTSEAERDGQFNGSEVELIEDGVDEEAYRKKFCENLNNLTNNRYSYKELAGLIRSWTQLPDLKISMDIGDDDCTDYHAIFDIEGDHPLAGEFDIYYLKMREDACVALGYEERIYITEVNASYYN
jgi:hypothetical protein